MSCKLHILNWSEQNPSPKTGQSSLYSSVYQKHLVLQWYHASCFELNKLGYALKTTSGMFLFSVLVVHIYSVKYGQTMQRSALCIWIIYHTLFQKLKYSKDCPWHGTASQGYFLSMKSTLTFLFLPVCLLKAYITSWTRQKGKGDESAKAVPGKKVTDSSALFCSELALPDPVFTSFSSSCRTNPTQESCGVAFVVFLVCVLVFCTVCLKYPSLIRSHVTCQHNR